MNAKKESRNDRNVLSVVVCFNGDGPYIRVLISKHLINGVSKNL